jgi:hypothetical protein
MVFSLKECIYINNRNKKIKKNNILKKVYVKIKKIIIFLFIFFNLNSSL